MCGVRVSSDMGVGTLDVRGQDVDGGRDEKESGVLCEVSSRLWLNCDA